MSIDILISGSISKIASYGKLLSEETRLKILWELLDGEKCGQDLAACLQMTASAISHQLRELRVAGIVKKQRVGRQMYYSFADERIREQVMSLFGMLS